jgi:hypothetical protein
MKNKQQRVANVWLILTFIFLFIIFIPAFVDMDMMNGGFAMQFLSGFMVIIGIVVFVIYRKRAKILNKLLTGNDILVHWKYSPEEWKKYSEIDFTEDKIAKRGLLILVAVIALVIGIVLSIANEDPLFLLICIGIIVIVAIPAFLVPKIRHSRNQSRIGEVLIAPYAVYLNGAFHNWNMLGAKMEKVNLDESVDPKLIRIMYSFPTRTGRQEEEIRVPVPKGEDFSAQNIVNVLENNLKEKSENK